MPARAQAHAVMLLSMGVAGRNALERKQLSPDEREAVARVGTRH